MLSWMIRIGNITIRRIKTLNNGINRVTIRRTTIYRIKISIFRIRRFRNRRKRQIVKG